MKQIRYSILCFLLFFSCVDDAHKKETSLLEVTASRELEILDFENFEPLLNKKDDTIYIINFWATWCAPCVKELPYLEQIKKNYADKNVEVILVSLDFPKKYESKLKPFIKKYKLKSRVIALNDIDFNSWIQKVNQDWTGAIPATLIYNKDKREFYERSFDYKNLESELKQFLK